MKLVSKCNLKSGLTENSIYEVKPIEGESSIDNFPLRMILVKDNTGGWNPYYRQFFITQNEWRAEQLNRIGL